MPIQSFHDSRDRRERPNDLDFVRSHYLDNPASIRCSVAIDADGGTIGVPVAAPGGGR
jgi:hypothetical protein